jgi:serine/threonine protein kinase
MPAERPAARILAPGSRLGTKYNLVRRIATGGMGEVWLAQNATTHANVALKVLRPDVAARSAEAADRFRREARLAGILSHRSIVRIFDFLEEPDGTLVLVMELLQGETLEHWLLRRGPLSDREATAVMAAVLSALQHGHEQGIVHRDVKPSNIFLSVESDGKVIPKLLDYGIAKMPKNDSKTMDGVVLGTPSYMSPEQIRSEEDIDGRSDLFSCAVVFYEVLTGSCPFAAPSPSAAIAAVLQSAVDPDPRIAPRLWLELQRALSKRPKQRHASAAEMRSAMLDVLGETEDSLGPALQGIKAREYGAERTGQMSALTAREAETRSVEGQSVATFGTPRKRMGWWPWAALGAVVGSIVMAVVMTRGVRASEPLGREGERPAAASIAPIPNGAPLPSAVVAPPAEDLSPAPVPVATVPASNTAAVATHTTTSPPHVVHHPPAPKPHSPKPVATSPGF